MSRIINRSIATGQKSCCSCGCTGTLDSEQISKAIEYSDKEMQILPDANFGLGCGNPTALANIHEGDIVLDLGSGAGFDCFLASKKGGSSGKVIGVDMTEEMISKAKENDEIGTVGIPVLGAIGIIASLAIAAVVIHKRK